MTDASSTSALRRLLGPGAREVTCEVCFEQLDRFVDAEARGADPEAEAPGMRAHLAGCPACAEDYESLAALVAEQ